MTTEIFTKKVSFDLEQPMSETDEDEPIVKQGHVEVINESDLFVTRSGRVCRPPEYYVPTWEDEDLVLQRFKVNEDQLVMSESEDNSANEEENDSDVDFVVNSEDETEDDYELEDTEVENPDTPDHIDLNPNLIQLQPSLEREPIKSDVESSKHQTNPNLLQLQPSLECEPIKPCVEFSKPQTHELNLALDLLSDNSLQSDIENFMNKL